MPKGRNKSDDIRKRQYRIINSCWTKLTQSNSFINGSSLAEQTNGILKYYNIKISSKASFKQRVEKAALTAWDKGHRPSWVKTREFLTQKKKKKVGSIKAKSDDSFYKSWEWKKVRYQALQKHGHRCMCCGWSPKDSNQGRLVVDHIKPRRKFPNLELDINNLQVLCNDCNMGKGSWDQTDYRTK